MVLEGDWVVIFGLTPVCNVWAEGPRPSPFNCDILVIGVLATSGPTVKWSLTLTTGLSLEAMK